MTAHLIERQSRLGVFQDRLHIKGFCSSDEMHRFLNKEDNACRWHESRRGLKPGCYVMAGGDLRDVRSLDAGALAHL